MQHSTRGVDFLGLADVVYPVFLFVVGMSIPFALENRFRKGLSCESTLLHMFARFFALLIMGAFTEQTLSMGRDLGMSVPIWKSLMVVGFFLVWNTYPKTDKKLTRHLYTALQIAGVLLLVYLAYVFRDREGRLIRGSYGILGSIGWAYLICALVYLFVRNNVPKIFFFWLGMLLYTMATMATNKTAEPFSLIPREAELLRNLVGSVARVSSTTVLTMGGVLFSLLLAKYAHLEVRKKILFYLSLTGIVFVFGFIAHQFWIVAKLGSTPTWVLYNSAIAIGVYGLLHWAVASGKAHWFNIIKAGGTATLACYVMPYFLQGFFYTFKFGILPGSINQMLPAWAKTDIGGLIKCFIWALLCILFTGLLERFKIKLKI
jgi:predicted acyltransferase